MAITKYDLDINKQAIIKPVVILRQGDHDIDTMQVSLSVANEPMDLTGATVTFMGNTANGRQIIDDAHVKIIDAKGGVFEYVFPSEASSDIGEYKVAYFSIILANGQSSTMDFRVQVLSGVDISAPVASEYISHYDTMVTELNSAYDSATNATNEKMASTVSSLATSAATVLDSALARVNTVNSTANSASSAASKAVSMASSVANTVTSQASYINSVASSAASNVSSVAAGVVDKLNNISVGGRNLLLDTGRSFTGIGNNSTGGMFDAQGGKYYLAGGKTVSDLYNQYGQNGYLTLSFDWVASGSTLSGRFNPQWAGQPYGGLAASGAIFISSTNTSGHYKTLVPLNQSGYSTGTATSVQFRQDNLQGNITISNVKLEAGNIATDWTPAPEDVPSNDAQLVHKTGPETIDGDKKFTSPINGQLVTEPFNLLHNTEFENNFSGWSIVNPGGNATIVASTTGGGHQYARISAGATALTDNVYFEQVVTGVSSMPYTLSFYGWASANNSRGAGAWIVEVNSTGGETASNFIDFGESTSWTRYYLTFTPASTTTSLKIRLKLNRNKSNIAVGFTMPQLEPSTTPSAYVRGSEMQAVPDDSNIVHKTGNETVAGDKTLTGNTTLANIKSSNVKTGSVKLGGLTINFRETAVGVNVYMDGSWQGSFGMGDGYVDSGSIPTSISNPRQNVVLNLIGNAGVGGVTTNSPFKLEVLITTDGKVKYRSKNLRDNDTAARTATIVGAVSTFYALD